MQDTMSMSKNNQGIKLHHATGAALTHALAISRVAPPVPFSYLVASSAYVEDRLSIVVIG